MVDIVDKKTRSRMMSGIRGKNTKPEIRVRSILHRAGYRFRLHARKLPGSPDVVLPKHNTVVFVHGCFWHRHNGCRYATKPKTRTEFWLNKLEGNAERDRRNEDRLRDEGWTVVIIWECELRKKSDADVLSIIEERMGKSDENGSERVA